MEWISVQPGVESRTLSFKETPQVALCGGGASGAHLAACAAVVTGFEDEPGEVSSRPDALVLFNPPLVIAATPVAGLGEAYGQVRTPRPGVIALSPASSRTAPGDIFHGTNDAKVPYASADLFAHAARRVGNRCELGHGFFNPGKGDGDAFFDTLQRTDRYLASLGYLQGEPQVARLRRSGLTPDGYSRQIIW